MKKMYRLRAQEDFRMLFRRGRKIDTPLFRFILRPNTLSHARVALVASRSVEKRAVLRNRLRRRTREWIRGKALLGKPRDMAIIFKKEAPRASRRKLYEELERIRLWAEFS